MSGLIIAIIGAAVCVTSSCIGSALAVQSAGKAGAGVLSEKPDLFGKVLVLQALPGTQGMYGFLIAVLIINQLGMLAGGSIAEISVSTGWMYFCASLPMAIVGLISAIYQGNMSVASINLLAKQEDSTAKGITMTALVETYAILALLVSVLLVLNIK